MSDTEGQGDDPQELTVEDLEALTAEVDALLQKAARLGPEGAVTNFELLVIRVQALIELALPELPDRRRLALELRYQRKIKALAESKLGRAEAPKLAIVRGLPDGLPRP